MLLAVVLMATSVSTVQIVDTHLILAVKVRNIILQQHLFN